LALDFKNKVFFLYFINLLVISLRAYSLYAVIVYAKLYIRDLPKKKSKNKMGQLKIEFIFLKLVNI